MALGRKTGGRQPGTPNKATAEVRRIASEYGEDALSELARLANEATSEQARIAACNALLDRGFGRSTGRAIEIDMPDTSTPDGIAKAVAAVVAATARGEITTSDAADLCSVLETQRRVIETSEIVARLARLEEKLGAA